MATAPHDIDEDRFEPTKIARRLGRYGGDVPGPTLVCTAAVHGDELAGVKALQRVFRRLRETSPKIRGRFVGFVGNLGGLAQDRRYLRADLNRIWLHDNVGALEQALADGGEPGEGIRDEYREQWELLRELRAAFGAADGEIYFLDLHTSSADGEPFVCVGDTLRNRGFALQFPVPVILGLEECIDGALLEYVNNKGIITMGVEAGQHRARRSVDFHEAFVWLGLVNSGILDVADFPAVGEYRELLRQASGHLPPIMEVRYRHPLARDDAFAMEPGFRNFQRIRAGEVLAREHGREVRAPVGGRILLPLYQGLGSDGFFVTREVRPFWLKVSAVLRHLRIDSLLPLLPGVQRHPGGRATLIVNEKVARWHALEVFHLLGYRKRRTVDGNLVMSRREYDHRPPSAL